MKSILILMLVFLPICLNAWNWGKVEEKLEKATDKIEKTTEKEEKVDRLNSAIQERDQKRRDRKAEKQHKENQKKMLENNMCMQYQTMNSKMMKDAYANDPKSKANMDKQILGAIDEINIEYERTYGHKFDCKNNCKQ